MTGQIKDIEGTLYDVQIGTAAGTLTFGTNPVTLSVAKAAHKFAGLKTMTATFRIVTDTPLTALYAATATSVPATLKEHGSSDYLFYGYVIPFAYDQPYDGWGDEVEIEAVDCLSALKYTSQSAYLNRSVQQFENVSQSALDILKAACEYAGVTKIVEHQSFADTLLAEFMMSGKAFLDDYGNNGETIGNIVSSVAQFFGFTAVVDGRTLVLWDESALGTTRDAWVHTYANGTWSSATRYDWFDDIQITGDDIAGMNGKVSIERAYDGVTVQLADTDGAAVIPDILSDDSLNGKYADDTVIHWYQQESGYGGAYRMAMKSKLIKTGRSSANGLVDFTEQDGYMQPNSGEPGDDWKEGSVLMKYWFLDQSEDGDPSPAVESNLLWVRLHLNNDTTLTTGVSLFETIQGEGRPHIRGALRVKLKARVNTRTQYGRDGWEVPEGTTAIDTVKIPWMFVKCGNLYLNVSTSDDGYAWTSSRTKGPFSLVKKENRQSGYASAYLDSGWISAPPSTDGVITIEGYVPANMASMYAGYDFFFEEMKIETRGDAIDAEALTTSFISNAVDYLQVSLGIAGSSADDGSRLFVEGHYPYGQNGCRKRFLLGNTGWRGQHVVLQTADPGIAGFAYPLLCRRYADKHIAYQLTCDNAPENTDLKPYSLVNLVWADSTAKTVEAWTWEVADCEKTILID